MENDSAELHKERMARRKEAFEARKARATTEKGLLIVHTGAGKGKTTAALGLAFRHSRKRLSLSGTPFRSDTRSIPFIRYVEDEADPDFEYGYGPALAEQI